MFKDLKLRVLSGTVLITVFFIVVLILPVLIKPLLFLLAFILLNELYALTGSLKPSNFTTKIISAANTSPLIFSQDSILFAFLIAAFLTVLTMLYSRAIFVGIGQLYIMGSLILLLNLVVSEPPLGGFMFLIIFVTCVILSDIGGYFGGQIIGGKKVFERVSPNKTWAGIIVGWLLVILFYYFVGSFSSFVFFESPLSLFLFLGIALSSQIGDFIESYTKRYYDVKDTGKIIPGHGGALDRFDGMIFSVYFVGTVDFLI